MRGLFNQFKFYGPVLKACLRQKINFPAWRNYLAYKTLNRFYRHRRDTDVLPYGPCSATLWMTGRCNLSCTFCHYDGELLKPTAPETPLSFREFARLYEESPYLRTALRYALYGGEALLRDELPDFIRFLRERGHIVSVNTNGLLLRKRWPELEACPPHFFSISYYPENAAALAKIVPVVTRKVPVRLSAVAFGNDLDRVEKAVSLAADWGVRLMAVDNFVPNGRETHEPVPAGSANFERLKTALEKKHGGRLTIEWPPGAEPPVEGRRTECNFFWNSVFINHKAEFSGCCAWKLESYRPLVPDLWNGETLRELRRSMKENRPPAACQGCRGLYADTSAV